MLRKLNFTERVKIPRGAVQIALRRDPDGVLAFDSELDLSAVDAPSAARVFIEAHYRTSYMRFDCGTAGNSSIPENRRLSDIDSESVVRFRVKVVDETESARRIVAATDDVTLSVAGETGGSQISLLPVNFRDLGDLPWRVEIESGGAVLELNNRIDGIERMARHDASFFGLVYSAAVREILTTILIVDEYDSSEDAAEWWSLWLRWARDLTDAPLPEEREERRVWVDDVVSAFCGRHRILEKMHTPGGEPA